MPNSPLELCEIAPTIVFFLWFGTGDVTAGGDGRVVCAGRGSVFHVRTSAPQVRLQRRLRHGAPEVHDGLLFRAPWPPYHHVPRVLSTRPHRAHLHRGGQGPHDVRLHGRVLRRHEEEGGDLPAARAAGDAQRDHRQLSHCAVDLRSRRLVLHGARVLQPLLPRHVPRQKVHASLQQQHLHLAAAGKGGQAQHVPLRRPRGLRLPRNSKQHGEALLPQGARAAPGPAPHDAPAAERRCLVSSQPSRCRRFALVVDTSHLTQAGCVGNRSRDSHIYLNAVFIITIITNTNKQTNKLVYSGNTGCCC